MACALFLDQLQHHPTIAAVIDPWFRRLTPFWLGLLTYSLSWYHTAICYVVLYHHITTLEVEVTPFSRITNGCMFANAPLTVQIQAFLAAITLFHTRLHICLLQSCRSRQYGAALHENYCTPRRLDYCNMRRYRNDLHWRHPAELRCGWSTEYVSARQSSSAAATGYTECCLCKPQIDMAFLIMTSWGFKHAQSCSLCFRCFM
jgi:hypothetical protein